MEQIQIIGNIGKDAEIKEHNGNKFVTFNVAVNANYKDANGQKVERTNWYSVTTQNQNLAQWLKSGTRVFVQGRLKTSIYETQNGENRINLEIAATNIELQPSGKKETETAATTGQSDDLPF